MGEHEERYRRLKALFAGRDSFADIGQISATDANLLRWGHFHGYIWRERQPWPGPVVGTCMKTFYGLLVCEICGEPAGAGGALCLVHLREAGIE